MAERLTKVVNGKRVFLSAEEEANVRAEWAFNLEKRAQRESEEAAEKIRQEELLDKLVDGSLTDERDKADAKELLRRLR